MSDLVSSQRAPSPWAPSRTPGGSATSSSSRASARESAAARDSRRRRSTPRATSSPTTSKPVQSRLRERARHPRGRRRELGPPRRRDRLSHRHEGRLPDLQPPLGRVLQGQPALPHDGRGRRAADADRDRAEVHRHDAGVTMSRLQALNFKKWIDENRHLLKPPVGNKHDLGRTASSWSWSSAARTRASDYHINEGEEFFYQLEGDIVLNVLEDGKPKDIPIREGEIFLLPPERAALAAAPRRHRRPGHRAQAAPARERLPSSGSARGAANSSTRSPST